MESTLLDFLGQLPPIVYVMFCGSGITLFISLVLIVNARIRRSQQRMIAQSEAAAQEAFAREFATYRGKSSDGSADDLPDLDALVNMPPAPATASANPTADAQFTADELSTATPVFPAATDKTKPRTYSLRLNNGRQTEVVEILTVVRDLSDGKPVVVINGTAYHIDEPITDSEDKRRFETNIRELARSLNGGAAATSTPARPAPDKSAAPPPPAEPFADGTPGALPDYTALADQPMTPKKRKELEPVPELNIAGAIEAYLQYKLRQTPDYAGRSIHVHAAPGGGVKIEVDGRFFDMVDEVDEPGVRDFITTAIAEWQERQ